MNFFKHIHTINVYGITKVFLDKMFKCLWGGQKVRKNAYFMSLLAKKIKKKLYLL